MQTLRHRETKIDTELSRRSKINPTLVAVMTMLTLTGITIREMLAAPEKETEKTVLVDQSNTLTLELEQFSLEVDRALDACNSLENMCAVPLAIATLPKNREITLSDLHLLAEQKLSGDLSASVHSMLEILERNPALTEEAVRMTKGKLDALSMMDWRRYTFGVPLETFGNQIVASAQERSVAK